MAEQDMVEKTIEWYNDVFADIVNVLLFDGKRIIPENALVPETPLSLYKTDGKLHQQERDVSKYWKHRNVKIAILGLENQTCPDKDMPLRIISYDGASYRSQLLEKEKSKKRFAVVTLVLYFGYKHRWTQPRNLLERLDVHEALKPYINDYHINVFEIAWLPDETVAKFKSDFRIIADYFVQMRKNRNYIPSQKQIQHVHEFLQLMTVMTGDKRYEEVYYKSGKELGNMCEVLDAVENRGRIQAHIAAVTRRLTRLLSRNLPIDAQEISDIAYDNGITVEEVKAIAKENGISLS